MKALMELSEDVLAQMKSCRVLLERLDHLSFPEFSSMLTDGAPNLLNNGCNKTEVKNLVDHNNCKVDASITVAKLSCPATPSPPYPKNQSPGSPDKELALNDTDSLSPVRTSEKFYCRWCRHVTTNKVLLDEHVSSVHVKVNLPALLCDRCYFSSLSRVFMKIHIKNRHLEEKHQVFCCILCGYRSRYRWSVDRHFTSSHGRNEPK